MNDPSFAQKVISFSGKSVYQIELELAMGFYLQGLDVDQAWKKATEFTDKMEASNYPFDTCQN